MRDRRRQAANYELGVPVGLKQTNRKGIFHVLAIGHDVGGMPSAIGNVVNDLLLALVFADGPDHVVVPNVV